MYSLSLYNEKKSEESKSFENIEGFDCQNEQKNCKKNVKNGKNDIRIVKFIDKNVSSR